MTEQERREQVEKAIAASLRLVYARGLEVGRLGLSLGTEAFFLEITKQILALRDPDGQPMVMVRDLDQSLPENPYHPNPLREYDHQITHALRDGHNEGKEAMITAGFVKCLPEEGR